MSESVPSTVKQNLQSAHLILVSLKRDHEQALGDLNALLASRKAPDSNGTTRGLENTRHFNSEKIPLIKSALNRIQDGLDESEALLTVAKYVECLEAEMMKLRLHNQRLCEETSWLRDELKYTQTKLVKSESLLAQTLSEKQHLEFLADLNKTNNTENRRESIALGFIPHDPRSSMRHFMSSSIADVPFTSTHSTTTPSVSSGHLRQQFRDGGPSMTCSQAIDVNGLMNSSMVDADMNLWSCTQSFHPSLLGGGYEHRQATATVHKPPSVPPSLRTLHRIVVQYTNQGKHEVAAALCAKAINDLERVGGRDQADVAVLLNILALVYRDQGKYNEASDLLQNVVSIRERIFGSNNPLVAASLNNLAVLYAKAGRFSDAEPLCRRALAIREKLLGPNHLDVAKQLNNLALLCQSQGRFEEMESCLRRALDIYQKSHKPSSSIVLRAKNNLASALLKRGNLADAETLLKAVLTPSDQFTAAQPMVSSPVNITEADSAVFSVDGSCNGFPTSSAATADDPDSSSVSSHLLAVPPLWLMVEQAVKEGRSSLSRLAKLDLNAWASEARIELSIVFSAIRNLCIVYQRQGHTVQANLLRSWIQPMSVASRNNTPLSPDLSKPKDLTASTCLPCSSPHSNLSEHCFH